RCQALTEKRGAGAVRAYSPTRLLAGAQRAAHQARVSVVGVGADAGRAAAEGHAPGRVAKALVRGRGPEVARRRIREGRAEQGRLAVVACTAAAIAFGVRRVAPASAAIHQGEQLGLGRQPPVGMAGELETLGSAHCVRPAEELGLAQ
ncbi:hypothetical protein RZS08_18610, partial [Arthrospira platensis SPKY1]|nr:hypothetical protein [Arthrospira platensis SPKY1]